MQLSSAEKLIISMLADTMVSLKVKTDLDPEFILKAINSGNPWAISSRYGGFGSDMDATPHVIDDVHGVLQMWSVIERSVKALSPEDRKKLEVEAAPFGKDPKFPGFDGNNETDHLSAMRFMVDELGWHPDFKGRGGLNSHMPTLETYQRMKPAFKRLLDATDDGMFTADQLISLLMEKVHPSNR